MHVSRRSSLAAVALGACVLLGALGVTRVFAADDLSISLAQSPVPGIVGSPMIFTASAVSAASATAQADAPQETIMLPAGFTAISVASNPVGGWTFTVVGSLISATYVGTLPIAPATTLPDVVITATPGVGVVNLSTVTAVVGDTADANLADNTATLQLAIQPAVAAPDAAVLITPALPIYSVGNTATFTINVSTTLASDPITVGTSIDVTDLLPLGGSNVTVSSGPDWLVNSTATTSPSLITASYIGAYPIAPGTMLAPITVTMTVDATAGAVYTTTASVAVPGDVNALNDTATASVLILGGPPPPLAPVGTIAFPATSFTPPPYSGALFDPHCMYGCGPQGMP